ncbi:MAG: hypothetical protein R2712_29160 [Vicinamibacterales bacterium]
MRRALLLAGVYALAAMTFIGPRRGAAGSSRSSARQPPAGSRRTGWYCN